MRPDCTHGIVLKIICHPPHLKKKRIEGLWQKNGDFQNLKKATILKWEPFFVKWVNGLIGEWLHVHTMTGEMRKELLKDIPWHIKCTMDDTGCSNGRIWTFKIDERMTGVMDIHTYSTHNHAWRILYTLTKHTMTNTRWTWIQYGQTGWTVGMLVTGDLVAKQETTMGKRELICLGRGRKREVKVFYPRNVHFCIILIF